MSSAVPCNKQLLLSQRKKFAGTYAFVKNAETKTDTLNTKKTRLKNASRVDTNINMDQF